MALTSSNPLAINSVAPAFRLTDTVSDELKSLEQLKGEKGTLIMFICNHCPYVIHVNPILVSLAKEYMPKGISFIAISSNDIINYPDDAPEKMKKRAFELSYPFPYLYDETQEVAKAYDAACTPDFYLFNESLQSVYHGQLDASRPGNDIPLSGEDLGLAMERLLSNGPPLENQLPSIGCGIKWK